MISKRLTDPLPGHRPLTDRDHLIGKAQRVAHGAIRSASYHRQRVVRRLDAFVLEHGGEASRDIGESDALEIEALQAAENGGCSLRDFLRLGCREDEDDSRGWLLQNLEQCVPRFAGQHMRFIDDVHFEAVVSRRRIHRALAQIARIVDSAIGRSVDLDDVKAG
jgi:hypothetical protein